MREERDVLRELDWSKVYANVPGAVSDGVRVAQLRIRERGWRRKKMMQAVACAACLVVVAGGSALLLYNRARTPDCVLPLPPVSAALDANSDVYASRDDVYYHVRPDCNRIEGEMVELKLVTALEFEKKPCPVCAGNAASESY